MPRHLCLVGTKSGTDSEFRQEGKFCIAQNAIALGTWSVLGEIGIELIGVEGAPVKEPVRP